MDKIGRYQQVNAVKKSAGIVESGQVKSSEGACSVESTFLLNEALVQHFPDDRYGLSNNFIFQQLCSSE